MENSQLELDLAELRRDTHGVRWEVYFPSTTSEDVAALQEELLAELPIGTRCPCCGRWAKIYARKLNSGMVASLLWIVSTFEARKAPPGATPSDLWIEPQKEAPRHVLANRELGRLALWDLLEAKANEDDPERRTVGLWRPTALGVRFARLEASVPARVYVWDGKAIGRSTETVTAREALGDRFSYEELMGSAQEIRHG